MSLVPKCVSSSGLQVYYSSWTGSPLLSILLTVCALLLGVVPFAWVGRQCCPGLDLSKLCGDDPIEG